MLNGNASNSTQQPPVDFAAIAKDISEGKIEHLPKALWLKIYEYYLFDLTYRNKVNFNLVCKHFNTLANDEEFYKQLIVQYMPLFTDTSLVKSNDKEMIYNVLGFKLPPIDKPNQYIECYLVACMLRGKTYDQVMQTLRSRLPEFYAQLENKKALLKEMNKTFDRMEAKKKEIKNILVLIQGDATHPDNHCGLNFNDYVDTSVSFENFRGLVKLFTISETTPFEMALRIAAGTADLKLIQGLLAKQLGNLRGFYQPIPDLLFDLEALLPSGNIEQIRKLVGADFDMAKVRSALNSNDFVTIIENGKYDDIFEQMTPQVLEALIKLAGKTTFQKALLGRIIRAKRLDLLKHIEITDTDTQTSNKLAEVFLLADEKSRDIGNADANFMGELCQALLANKSFVRGMSQNYSIARWAFNNQNVNMLQQFFAPPLDNQPYNLDPDNEEHRDFATAVFLFAINNGHEDLLALMMQNAPRTFIPVFATSARSLKYPAIFMAQIKKLPPLTQEIVNSELLLEAALHRDKEAIDFLINQTQTPELPGDVAYVLVERGLANFSTMRQLVNKAKFKNTKIADLVASFFSNHTKGNEAFVAQFFAEHAEEFSTESLIDCMLVLPSELTLGLLKHMLADGRFDYFGRTENGISLDSLTQIPTFASAIAANPMLLTKMLGDRLNCPTRQYQEEDVSLLLSLFGPLLDTRAKLQLLSCPEQFELQRQLLKKYPQELDYFTLRAHLGEDHHLSHLVPDPGLIHRLGNMVAGYLPGFRSPAPQPATQILRRQREEETQTQESKARQKKPKKDMN